METKNKTKMAYLVFIDPTYSQGWIDRRELPEDKDAIHVGCGVVVRENRQKDGELKSVIFAFADGYEDKTGDVMHAQLIHKDCLIKYYTFSEELFDAIGKPRTAKRIQETVRREIDLQIEDYM